MTAEALVVIVGGTRHAVPMKSVIEVRVHAGATRIPGAPQWVCGIVERAGAPVEVFDAARRFGVQASGEESRRCVIFVDVPAQRRTMAMLVDDVDSLISIDDRDAPALIDVDAFFARGAANAEGTA